jgi:DNA alkylation damage repair protein AlkB
VQDWIAAVGSKTAYISPGSPWENGFIESFNARLRDELLDGEIWLTDSAGYRYDGIDPETGQPWPATPECFRALAGRAADRGGYPGFMPDSCLINRYASGSRLSLHQDRDERDYAHPIVSVSLGLPAIFQFGGLKRRDAVRKFPVRHSDVVVWGGPSGLAYHGVAEHSRAASRLWRLRVHPRSVLH